MRTLPFSPAYDYVAQLDPRGCTGALRRLGPEPARSTLLDLIRTTWRRRQSRACLAQFDDRMLKDIGLTRAEAELEFNKPFWRT
jgi:uncharacterized protein YjiS (DUF1127 family)